MTRITIGVCLALVLAATLIPSAPAQSETGKGFHRWGIGWDRGLGLRYYVDSTWGFGFRALAFFEHESVHSDNPLAFPGPSEADHLELGVMVFKEYRLGRWRACGPFLGFEYGYEEEAASECAWSMGLRPVLVWKKRFMMETRFGILMSYEYRRAVYLRQDLIARETTSGQRIETFGSPLGPGVTLQFIILF